MSDMGARGDSTNDRENRSAIRLVASLLLVVAGAACIFIGLDNRSSMVAENETMNDNKEWASSLYGMGYDRVDVDLTSVWVLVGVGIFLIVAALFVFLLYGRETIVVQSFSTPQPAMVPGWYDDPDSPLLLRYWDGRAWTEKTANKQTTSDAGTDHPATNGVTDVPDTVGVPSATMGHRDTTQRHEDASALPAMGSPETDDAIPSEIALGGVAKSAAATSPPSSGDRGKWIVVGVAATAIVGALLAYGIRTGSSVSAADPAIVSGATQTAITATEDFRAFFKSLLPNERENICDRFAQDSGQAIEFINAPLGGFGWEPYAINIVLLPECGLVQRGGTTVDPATVSSPTPAATAVGIPTAAATPYSRPTPTPTTFSRPAPTAATATEDFRAFFLGLRPIDRKNICDIYAGDSSQAVAFINASVGGSGWEPYVISVVLLPECGSLSDNRSYSQS